MALFRYLFKVFYHFLWVVFVSFFLTSIFSKNSDNAIFFNLSPRNYEREIMKDINNFIKKRTTDSSKILKKHGTSLYPIFFNLLKNNLIHKDEYLELYQKTMPNLFFIEDKNRFDVTFYNQEWKKIELIYDKDRLKSILNLWKNSLFSTENLLIELEKIGSISIQTLSFFIVDEFSYSDFEKVKPILKFLKQITPDFPFTEVEFNSKSEQIWDWWRAFVIDNRYYYLPNRFSLYIKVLLTQTQFYKWLQQVFSVSFGIMNSESVISTMESYFLATILNIFTTILLAYFISSKMILIFYKNRKNLFFIGINFILTIFTLLPIPLLPTIFWTINYFVGFEVGYPLYIYYMFSIFFITFTLFYGEQKLFMEKKSNEPFINTFKVFGMPENWIINRYFYKSLHFSFLNNSSSYFVYLFSIYIFSEYLFSFKGVGYFLLESIKNRDIYSTRLSLLLMGIIIILFRIFSDMIKVFYLKKLKQNERTYL